MPDLQPISLSARPARHLLQDGDLLLWRGRHAAIAVAGRGRHVHVAMVAWWGGDPWLIETVQRAGGRAILLQSAVDLLPGKIDLYHVAPAHYDRAAAVARAKQVTGRPYGRRGLIRVAAVHLPFLRWLARPDCDDLATSPHAPFCSHHAADAVRTGGVDLVPGLADHWTEPADLARSSALEYRGTLWP